MDAVREDPKKKGLLFAGSEREVYVSFDDGDHWQSLRLNMPASSVRDLAIKDDDLIAATHGRGFWILDDITPLRQMEGAATGPDFLFRTETAVRVRWDMNTDTPLPPDEPGGKKLTIRVKERPLIKEVDYRGGTELGLSAIKDKIKERKLTISPDSTYDPEATRKIARSSTTTWERRRRGR